MAAVYPLRAAGSPAASTRVKVTVGGRPGVRDATHHPSAASTTYSTVIAQPPTVPPPLWGERALHRGHRGRDDRIDRRRTRPQRPRHRDDHDGGDDGILHAGDAILTVRLHLPRG